jgi:hypothetical protein
MDSQSFDDHRGFPVTAEDLAVQAFISQYANETLAVAVLPG